MSIFLGTFWFFRTAKATLFWLYLWQLKEYHIGRFVDHFRTAKGKQLIFNWLYGAKIAALFLSFLWFQAALVALIAIYAAEIVKGMRQAARGKILAPVGTAKTGFLILVSFLGEGIFFAVSYVAFRKEFLQLLLLFDIFLPILVSFAVLLFQPLAVFARNRIIARARQKRLQFKNLKVIGITGSYGKTSTKEFLSHILSHKYRVLKTQEHKNSEIGIAKTILEDLNGTHEIFVCEIAAYTKGGIAFLAHMVQPQIAIITGANEQHLATFGSMKNLLSAEGGEELLEALPQNGVAIFNGANQYARELYKTTQIAKKVLCGVDLRAENINVKPTSVSFRLVSGEGESIEIKTNLFGGYNTENLLLAVAAAKELGMALQEIAGACATIPQELGAMQLKKSQGLNIIDSTYSANPNGVIAALEYVKVWPGKKVIVMPCLIELGSASKEVHQRIGEKIAEVCDLAIITTEDQFEKIKEKAGDKAIFTANPKEIFEMLKKFNRENDVILLEGGKESQTQRQLLALLRNE